MRLKYEPASEPLPRMQPSSSLLLSSLELSDTKVYEPQIRARLGTTAAMALRGDVRLPHG